MFALPYCFQGRHSGCPYETWCVFSPAAFQILSSPLVLSYLMLTCLRVVFFTVFGRLVRFMVSSFGGESPQILLMHLPLPLGPRFTRVGILTSHSSLMILFYFGLFFLFFHSGWFLLWSCPGDWPCLLRVVTCCPPIGLAQCPSQRLCFHLWKFSVDPPALSRSLPDS